MAILKVGDRVRVKDRPGWSGGYRIANWEGQVVEVVSDPAGYVVIKTDQCKYDLAFPEDELEKV